MDLYFETLPKVPPCPEPEESTTSRRQRLLEIRTDMNVLQRSKKVSSWFKGFIGTLKRKYRQNDSMTTLVKHVAYSSFKVQCKTFSSPHYFLFHDFLRA